MQHNSILIVWRAILYQYKLAIFWSVIRRIFGQNTKMTYNVNRDESFWNVVIPANEIFAILSSFLA